jgi:CheY-like chemotaxis protein
MVHGLAEQSGGQLVVKSKPGAGTTAEIWLPVASKVGVDAEAAAEAAASMSQPLTILAVDDDALILLNMVAMLEDLGHTVLEANSGPQALEVLRGTPSIDLVITDHAMPRMTGLELLAQIRTERPELPVIIASGYAELPSGSDTFRLPKPFMQYDLAQAVTNATAKQLGRHVVRLRTR